MENKAHAMAAGIFVVALSALLVLLAAWLTRDTGERDIYEISTRETVTGLQAQAPVRYRGVDVGKVAALGFDPKVQGNVLMRLEIEREAPVTEDTFATLGFQGVTGLSFVQLDDSGKTSPRLVPNDEVPPRIPLKPGLLSKISAKGEVILDQVEQITARMNKILADPNQQRLATALDNVGQAAASVNTLSSTLTAILNAQFGPDKVSIPTLVKNLDATLASVRGTSDEARTAVSEIGKTAKRLNEKDGPIDRLADGTQALSHAADAFNAATLPRINRATEDTSRAVRQLSRTVNGINDNPQSLIFGTGGVSPGPGESGFTPPGASR
ncbi:MlaD family protein [uncultured Ramlibacter sp.]|uniref:MlaD family protein n=1 Tax=uncultured Ramlibacter sp. TaxID=260755 RepID=UPI00261540CC|nr:MlaD family protein [uncultured Ramlibacter sp.]